MTPQEKAQELVEKYFADALLTYPSAIKCALIAVEEILKSNPTEPSDIYGKSPEMFWQAVRSHLQSLR